MSLNGLERRRKEKKKKKGEEKRRREEIEFSWKRLRQTQMLVRHRKDTFPVIDVECLFGSLQLSITDGVATKRDWCFLSSRSSFLSF